MTGQTADGRWELGVRRTIAGADPAAAWARLASPAGLRTLLDADVDGLAVGATFTDGTGATGTVRSLTAGEVTRIAWQQPEWDRASTLQLRVLPAASGATVAVHHEGLPDEDARRELRERWTVALDRLVAD